MEIREGAKMSKFEDLYIRFHKVIIVLFIKHINNSLKESATCTCNQAQTDNIHQADVVYKRFSKKQVNTFNIAFSNIYTGPTT